MDLVAAGYERVDQVEDLGDGGVAAPAAVGEGRRGIRGRLGQ